MPAFRLIFLSLGLPEAEARLRLFYIPDIAAGSEEKSL